MEKIVADGDSWIGYPSILGGNLGSHLANIMGAELINLARNGDTSQETAGLKNIQKLRNNLAGCTLFLISSGGDDFAGDQFRLALNNRTDGNISKAINWDWFNAALDLIVSDYQNFIALRNAICPKAIFLTHSYGFPPPSVMGKGVLLYGPWLQPGFIDRGWTDINEQSAIARLFLLEFENRISRFSKSNPRCIHTNLQPFLKPEHFSNELHLTRDGWQIAAELINAAVISYRSKD